MLKVYILKIAMKFYVQELLSTQFYEWFGNRWTPGCASMMEETLYSLNLLTIPISAVR